MKLYTEEQVRHAVKMARSSHNIFTTTSFLYDQHEILEKLTPIELPSDEEIEAQSKKWILGSQVWEKGAKWMKEQILNQNK